VTFGNYIVKLCKGDGLGYVATEINSAWYHGEAIKVHWRPELDEEKKRRTLEQFLTFLERQVEATKRAMGMKPEPGPTEEVPTPFAEYEAHGSQCETCNYGLVDEKGVCSNYACPSRDDPEALLLAMKATAAHRGVGKNGL